MSDLTGVVVAVAAVVKQEVDWWRRRTRGWEWRYVGLPFRLWPAVVVAVFAIVFVSLPWALASSPAAALIVPWCVAMAGAMLSAATATVGISFGVLQMLHGLIGTPYLAGMTATAREIGHLVSRSSTLVGRVSAGVLLLSPVGIWLASQSSEPQTGNLSQPKMVASVGLCLAVTLLSVALFLWTSEAAWRLLFEVPAISRFSIAVMLVAVPMYWMPDAVRYILKSALVAWVPAEVEGYSSQDLVDELVRTTPLPTGFVASTVTVFGAAAYVWLSCARSDLQGLVSSESTVSRAKRTSGRVRA